MNPQADPNGLAGHFAIRHGKLQWSLRTKIVVAARKEHLMSK